MKNAIDRKDNSKYISDKMKYTHLTYHYYNALNPIAWKHTTLTCVHVCTIFTM